MTVETTKTALHLATENGATLCGDVGGATVVINDCNCVDCLRRCLTVYRSMFSELTPIFYAMPWFAGDERVGADLGRRLTESVLPLLPPKEDE